MSCSAISLSITAAEELLNRRNVRRHLHPFVVKAFATVNPGTEFLDNWHIQYICECIENAYFNSGSRNIIINVPPRNLKSIICTVAFPAWLLGRDPSEQIMAASYSSKLSTKHSVDCRLIMESEWYRMTFPGTKIATDQNEKSKYQTTRRGHRIATSVGGTATGEGGNVLLLDDPMNPQEALSDTERDGVNTWIDQTWSSRMNSKDGMSLIIMQRLHEDDPTGHVMSEDLGYDHIVIPQEATTKTRLITFPISNIKLKRKKGELLHVERFDRTFIEMQKRKLGSYGYAGQYQQNPVPAGGGMFKDHWWQFYKTLPIVPDETIQSWDMTFKKTTDGSYVTGQVWARKGADRYLVDQIRDRMDFPETIREFIRMSNRYPEALRKLVEDKANGPAVIDTLSSKISGIISVSPDGGKPARAAAYAVEVEAGNIYLPDPTIYPEKKCMVEEFIEEHSRCPKGKYWDQIDSASQAVRNMSDLTMTDLFNVESIVVGDAPAALQEGSPWA